MKRLLLALFLLPLLVPAQTVAPTVTYTTVIGRKHTNEVNQALKTLHDNKADKTDLDNVVRKQPDGSVAIRATLPADGIVTVAGTSLTLGSAHAGAIVRFTSGSAVTVTVPPSLPVGYSATLLQAGAGLVSPLAGAGVTFTTSASTSGAGSSVFVQSTAADTFIMSQSGTMPTVATASLLAGLNGNAVAASWTDFATFMGGNLLNNSETLTPGAVTAWQAANGTLDSATQATCSTAATCSVYQSEAGFTVTPGAAYTFSWDAKLGTITGPKYSIYDKTHSSFIAQAVDYSAEVSTTAWARMRVAFTAPAGCTAVRVYPLHGAGGTGTIFLRRMQVQAGGYEKFYFKTATGLAQ